MEIIRLQLDLPMVVWAYDGRLLVILSKYLMSMQSTVNHAHFQIYRRFTMQN